MPTEVLLSQWIWFGGCGCPVSCSTNHMTFPSFAFKNKAPSSASASEATIDFRIDTMTKTFPLVVIGFPCIGLDTMKKYPAVQLYAPGFERYEMLE